MKLTFPADIHHLILFQRTQYLLFWSHRPARFLINALPFLSYEKSVYFEAKCFPGRVEGLYAKDIHSDFAMIAPHLPAGTRSVLDIGCGVAGIDILIYHHFKKTAPAIHLLDKSHIDANVFYDFKSKGAFYNSLAKAREFLAANGVPEDKVHTHEVGEDGRIGAGRFDVALSLISWGFHYPLDVYLDQVCAQLNPGGRVIVDIRKNTAGFDLLNQKFPSCTTIHETSKYERVVAVKPG